MSTSLPSFAEVRVLVVGGAGFVGSTLCRRLLSEGVGKVWVVDNLLSSETSNLPVDPRLELILGSIADDRVLAALPDPLDYVFHLATYHGNQSSLHDPIADHDNNTVTTLKLFERLKVSRGLRKLVYAGAGCTVAEKTFDKAEASVETDIVSLHLDSPYQISKVVGEFYASFYHRQHGLPVVRARFQNVYGPGEVLGAGRWRGTPATVWRNVTPTFIYKALEGEALTVENRGVATRDFIHVEDLVEGLLRCAGLGAVGEAYNLASGVETSILTLAETINRLTGNPAAIKFLPPRSWDRSGKRYGCTVKSEQALGFRAGIGLEEGLTQTVAWTRENLDRIKACMTQHAIFMAAL